MGREYPIYTDFDGVVHSYLSEWQGATTIPDPPVKKAFAWLAEMTAFVGKAGETFQVCIYSSRSKEPGAITAMKEWFAKQGLAESVLTKLEFPTQKGPAFLTIDDRVWLFEGVFPTPEQILAFRPWYRREEGEEDHLCPLLVRVALEEADPVHIGEHIGRVPEVALVNEVVRRVREKRLSRLGLVLIETVIQAGKAIALGSGDEGKVGDVPTTPPCRAAESVYVPAPQWNKDGSAYLPKKK